MIKDSVIDKVSDDLTVANICEFFRDHMNSLVYFYHVSEVPSPKISTLKVFGKGELKIPLRTTESGTFMVLYANSDIANRLVEGSFKVASSRLAECVDMANNLPGVNGVFVQGSNCWFTIGLAELNAGLNNNA